jgi:predicted secreted Zn-dependent protease
MMAQPVTMRSRLDLLAAPLAVLVLVQPAASRAEEPPPPPAFSGMPGIVFRYYDLFGTNDRMLTIAANSIRLRAPGTPGGATGLTTWSARMGWKQQDRPVCRITQPRTALTIVVTLPRLAEPDRLAPETFQRWRAYIRTIERHEAGHARIALAHSRDFERAAANASCANIKAIAQATQQRIVALQDDYDRRTQHGRNQDVPLD